MEINEALAKLHARARSLADAAWQADGQIAAADYPSRKRLDNARDLFKRADVADALYRLCLGAYLDRLRATIPTPEEGDVTRLLAEARDYLQGADEVPEEYVNDPLTVIAGIGIMRRLANALQAVPTQPSADAAGEWVLVPREPTEDMLSIASRECSPRDNWAAMLEYAPKPSGDLENAPTVLNYLDEAEAEWRSARDDSGYSRAARWAMDHGRKLIFGWRRAVQTAASPSPTWGDEQVERAARALTEHACATRGITLREDEWFMMRAGCMDGMRAALSALQEG